MRDGVLPKSEGVKRGPPKDDVKKSSSSSSSKKTRGIPFDYKCF